MNSFQTILLAVFLAFFGFGVLIFSGLIKIGGSSGSSTAPQGKVTIWGTFKGSDVASSFQDLSDGSLTLSYASKSESEYEQSLIEAFAKGTAPDIFIITPSMIQKFEGFIYKVPYTGYPEKTFRDLYIDGADIFLAKDGIVGFPLAVDPIVMYYNKNSFSNEGIASIPTYWDELFDLSSILTKKSDNGSISQSMIALGRYDNINNAKDILATLLIQSGDPIIGRTATGYAPVLTDITPVSKNPAGTVFDFFTQFSNPNNTAYSWNRALPNSAKMFTSGKLAMYIGRASELFAIQSINPNLSFDVSQVLQARGADLKRTYGDMYALAINKRSTNLASAYGVVNLLSQDINMKKFSAIVSLPPASRTLLAVKPTSPYLFTFFNSAVISHSWLDPDETKSNAIFSESIDNILSNKFSVDEAVSRVEGQLKLIIKK